MWVTQILADFIFRFRPEDVSVEAREMAKRCLLDLLGASIAGFGSDSAKAICRMSQQLFAPGSCCVWFTEMHKLQAAAAALANSSAASALDLDDGHRVAGGHPGASIIPAALAVAQEVQASGLELLAAIIIGYEIGVRIAGARDFALLDTLSTGRWCAYGAAAAGAWLGRLPKEQVAEALAIAGVQAPGLSAAGYSSVMGNQVKEGIPWSTFTGLAALHLAANGFTGPLDILDHPSYYDSGKILQGLGEGAFAIETVYFKPYSCCRWIHSALDALLQLIAEYRIEAKEIDRVVVSTFSRALRLNNYSNPASVEGAQYSVPFCLAVAALRGEAALLPLDERCLGNPELISLAEKVELEVDSELDVDFPAHVPARVTIKTAGAEYQRLVKDPRGDPSNPLDDATLQTKFRQLTGQRLFDREQQNVIAIIEDLENCGLNPFFNFLSKPLAVGTAENREHGAGS